MAKLDKLKNVKLVLKKFATSYQGVLRKTAKVRTGALRNSLKSKLVNGKVITEMLAYGSLARNWSTSDTPQSVLKKQTKKYSKKLAKALEKDLRLTIKKVR